MEEYLKKIGVGTRPWNDPFLQEFKDFGNGFKRVGLTLIDDEELLHDSMKVFECNYPGCPQKFRNLMDYELHYNANHRFVCSQCKKTRTNARLLEIHVQESHDNYFKVLSAKQPMYQCYVTECTLKFLNPVERRDHCVQEHKFPKSYAFEGIESSKKKQGKTNDENKMEVDNNACSSEVVAVHKPEKHGKFDLNKTQKQKTFSKAYENPVPKAVVDNKLSSPRIDAPDAMPVGKSALMFIPRQVHKNYAKRLTNNECKERNVLDSNQVMMDLAESLPQ